MTKVEIEFDGVKTEIGRSLSADRVRHLLEYNDKTGALTWRVYRQGMRKDLRAGSLTPQGYVRIGIDGKDYCAHIIIWLYVTGEWPDRLIDHSDLNKSNNAWENIRLATMSQNKANSPKHKDNCSGFKGVVLAGGRWRARIRVRYRLIHIGYYSTREDAHAAYEDAATLHFGEFARAA